MNVYIPASSAVSFTSVKTMPDLTTLQLIGSTSISTINFPQTSFATAFDAVVANTPNTNFAVTFTGQFLVTLTGPYTFCTTSDDGSVLSVDGILVVNNSAIHAGRLICSTGITLNPGVHSIFAYYFQAAGWVQMQVTYSGPDTANTYVFVQISQAGFTTCTTCPIGSYSSVNGTEISFL